MEFEIKSANAIELLKILSELSIGKNVIVGSKDIVPHSVCPVTSIVRISNGFAEKLDDEERAKLLRLG